MRRGGRAGAVLASSGVPLFHSKKYFFDSLCILFRVHSDRVTRRVQHRHRLALVDLAPIGAELPGSESDDRYFSWGVRARATQFSMLHGPRFALRAIPCHARGG